MMRVEPYALPYALGSTDVIWTVTDGSGNTATCTQVTVTVNDTEDPGICTATGDNCSVAHVH